jgi:hypothetical protein
MVTLLLLSLVTGSCQVVLTDERRKGGDLSEVEISVTNKSDSTVGISFEPGMHLFFFRFNLYDDKGQPVKLPPAYNPDMLREKYDRVRIKPGETVTGYLSPKVDFQIPPGRYQLEVEYYYGGTSNRITKTFR